MDAASRAELDALRRRAYGPTPDIHDDDAALARLIELEDLARPRAVEPVVETLTPATTPTEATADTTARGVVAVTRPPHAVVPGATPATTPSARRWRRRTALVASGAAAVAVVVSVILTQQQPSGLSPFAAPSSDIDTRFIDRGDPGAETLLTVRLDGYFAQYSGEPTDGYGPAFPTRAELDWATPVGNYYGWDLWVAGGSGWADDEHCILIQREDDTRARCVTHAVQRVGKLRVELEASDISPDELPRPMDDDESIRFWWLEDGQIDVVLGSFTAD